MRKTPRERQEEERARKLEDVQEQLDRGSLVIRQMTTEERKLFPAKPRPAKWRRRGGA